MNRNSESPTAAPPDESRPGAQAEPSRWTAPANRWIVSLLILVVALTARLIHIQEASQGPLMKGVIPMRDSRYYDMIARRVAEGDILGDHVFFLAPMYPYSLAIPYYLFRTEQAGGGYEYNITAVRYFQCVTGALGCWLLYWVGCLALGRLPGTLAGLIAACYGLFVYYDGILMPTSQILFLHLLALFLLLLAARRGSPGWWIASGAALGMCALAHGTAVLLTIGVLIWILVGFPDVAARTRKVRAVLVAAAFVPLIAIVTVRNYVVGQDFVLLTSNGGRNLYIGNNPTATGSFRSYPAKVTLYRYLHGLKRQPGEEKPSEVSRQFASAAIRFAIRHPVEELLLLLKKVQLFFNAVEVGINDHFYFAGRFSQVLRWPLPSFGLIVPIGLTGLIFALGEWRRHLLLIVFVASQVISFTLIFVLARYRVVAVACLMLLAGAQIGWWIAWGRNRRYRRLAASVVVLAAATLLVHFPIRGFDQTRGLGQQYAQVGQTYLSWDQYEEALGEFEKAVRSNFEPWMNHHLQRARCYAGMGDACAGLHRLPQALQCFKAALAEIELESLVLPKKQEDKEYMARRLSELQAELGAGR